MEAEVEKEMAAKAKVAKVKVHEKRRRKSWLEETVF